MREHTARRSLTTGKLPVELLADLLAELPPAPPEVRLGPAVGEDACAVEIPGGMLVAATDPITLTGEDIGRWSVIVNANDVAVTGARPRWFLAVVAPLRRSRETRRSASKTSSAAPTSSSALGTRSLWR